jgi:hypothetical protein
MPDRDGTLNMNPESSLAAALRGLPDAAPQPDLWPELARTLERRRRPRVWRYAIPVALAAGLALALLLPRGGLQPTQPEPASTLVNTTSVPAAIATPAPVSTAAPDELDNLHQRSQTLERWIAAVAARAPQDSRDLMAAVEVEDLIGFVDVQLGAAHSHDDALPLWRQRVALLEDLATIRGSAYAIAANDDATSRDDASLNRIN